MTNEPLHFRVEQLERQVRVHQHISLAALLAVSVVATAAFQTKDNNARFTGLTVERLNVAEPDGQLVLTIANTARLPDPLIAGKTVDTPEDRKVLDEKLRGASAQRMFVGSEEETAMVRMRDRAGRDRIRLSVNAQGVAQLEFLDEADKVVERLPK